VPLAGAPTGAPFDNLQVRQCCRQWVFAVAACTPYTLAHHTSLAPCPAAFLGLGVTVAGYLVIQYTNSLTLKILANFRSIAIIAISAVFFGEHVTPLEIFGYGVSLVGFALYTVSERQVPPALKDAAKKGQ
jgi:drug/metabolite transporter (DMT)-like permease